MKRRKALARPKRTKHQTMRQELQGAEGRPQCMRQLQKAIAVAKCIAIAAEYSEHEDIDFADALAVLLLPLEQAAVLLDSPGSSS